MRIFMLCLFGVVAVLMKPSSASTVMVCKGATASSTLCEIENVYLKVRDSANISGANSKMTDLVFKNSKIKYTPSGIFDAVPGLKTLKFDNANVKEIDGITFKKATALKEISFNSNEIEEISDSSFAGVGETVEVLKLASNEIAKIDSKAFKDMRSLKEISLDNNKLKSLPKDVFKYNTNLEKIYLSNNKYLKFGKKFFDDLKNLKEVDLTGNKCGGRKFNVTNKNFKELNNVLATRICSAAFRTPVSITMIILSVLVTFLLSKE